MTPGSRPTFLLVDDEPMLLRSLTRLLASTCPNWTCITAGSAAEALELLERQPVDVVLTDFNMPGMSGGQLLARVQAQYPATIRIILSATDDPMTVFRAAPVAHQMVSKPFTSTVLIASLDRALGLRALLNDELLAGLVAGDQRLPSPPRVFTALQRVLARDNADSREIVAALTSDPALTAQLTRLGSSSLFALPGHARNIEGVVRYLGAERVKAMVLALEALRFMGPLSPAQQAVVETVHARSLRAAALAREIMSGERSADLAFLAAMMHDLGRLVLVCRAPKEYAVAEQLVASAGVSISAAERRVFGADHAEVGAYLLALWGQPEAVIRAVAGHHSNEPLFGGSLHVALAVQVAVRLAEDPAWPARRAGEGEQDDEAIDLGALEAAGALDRLPQWRNRAAALGA